MGHEAESRARKVHALTKRDGPNCFYCDVELIPPPPGAENNTAKFSGWREGERGREQTLDHWRPRALNGGSSIKNLRLACYVCNMAKGTMSGEEFLQSATLKARRAWLLKARRKDHGVYPTGFGYWHPDIRIDHPDPERPRYRTHFCALCGRMSRGREDSLSLFPCVIFDGVIPLEGSIADRVTTE